MHRFRVDPLRVEGPLMGTKRAAALERCNALTSSITSIDTQLAALSAQRRQLRNELRSLHRRIAPNLARRAGRQPAADGSEQLPPVRRDAVALWGRRLRSVCLALLRRHGRLPLTDLHVLLHRHGYVVANHLHVKALADALGHEADAGRVRRVRRGVYEIVPGPLPGRGRHGDPRLLQERDPTKPRFSATRNATSELLSV